MPERRTQWCFDSWQPCQASNCPHPQEDAAEPPEEGEAERIGPERGFWLAEAGIMLWLALRHPGTPGPISYTVSKDMLDAHGSAR